ncbi:hypothetical protein IF188_11270 [Microbacterium sp. NEAU-LLC]|uniref:Cadherin-like domain-containing protein n=1 Tax=Microbacterium helvum TaxID=2773713 RepID=A0ABR8NR95_9MICO|nr:hypothetical protein [Microbacterium helvum]MBD3942277.1 hypothetical protein [Microbacterium helvum]
MSAATVEAALTGAAAPLVAEAVDAKTTTADAAVTDGQAAVAIPRDPTDGVKVSLETTSISINLPAVDQASDAVALASGAIAYPSDNGVANAVVPLDGGLQLLTTISSPDAPTSFAYDITISDGGQVVSATDGSALVLSARGEVLLRADAPWAVDANGTSVPTHYEVNGTRLVQVVDHNADFAYPVVADPRFDQGVGWKSILFNRWETRQIASAGFIALGGAATACSVAGPAGVAACGLAAAAIGATATYAKDNGMCVGLSFWGIPPYMGWNPFVHSGRDCY